MTKIGNKIKESLKSNDLIVNVLSTVIGIMLTFGVGAYVQYRQDKKLARSMMFNVVKVTENNGKVVKKYSDMFEGHIACVDSLLALYNRNEGNLDKVPNDTLGKYLDGLTKYCFYNYSEPEIYISNAQTMQQFGNRELFEDFQTFVQLDKQTFAEINNLIAEWKQVAGTVVSKERRWDANSSQVVKELIESNVLTDYQFRVEMAILGARAKMYKQCKDILLKVMDASEEEYQDYLDENDDNLDSKEINVKEKRESTV